MLTGIHLSSYGREIDGESHLIELIEAIHPIDGISRIRLGSLEPRIITEEFVGRLKKLHKVCPHSVSYTHLNVKGGRCEACSGDGIVKIEMHFLPDVYVPCEVCKGKRYNRETLEVKYKGKSIYDVLNMTVEEALTFFENVPSIYRKIETLYQVGLSYIRLGQPSTTPVSYTHLDVYKRQVKKMHWQNWKMEKLTVLFRWMDHFGLIKMSRLLHELANQIFILQLIRLSLIHI